MRIIRFLEDDAPVMGAVTDEGTVYRLACTDFLDLVKKAKVNQSTPLQWVRESIRQSSPLRQTLADLHLLVPIDAPEVWAAGVTYERSKEARNFEATGGNTNQVTVYDKVYEAPRPELFIKSTSRRTVGPNQPIYLRSDSNWQIPEPELGLVIDQQGEILGFTIGNDMSCRDIEGENPLYLPQAKIWRHSCSIGPSILLAESVADPYRFQITCRIYRRGEKVVEGTASTGQLKRKLHELIEYLIKDNQIFDGTVLLTGTCIVPPDDFTLLDGDRIEIEISDIGILSNPVKQPAG
ncbi:fumarylacetoacetate hydrolase family protein [Lihuaxuella thermophila]|uniref:2-dehydro-3-deoxy-D-arabinonate dehydratase n=1 Tax=Lihuaxuella thermophila TaxID=1173111 RepID=A0A1H8J6S3_9BACL|nr:fumarylacetoacetate hydrolase family protein [Lihuaxuella thermophila]SEN76462.1 2-dehydro-3-deoxy-D-arabinonate dehydratase [Lihuaxuella thermophila]